ncbi:carboxypeptidase regulatory-like domain-containing protein [bacterium]|nr:carboxypeptidase regulatory-like domain-containing protein [candidate division CSSED10-310 bacterium]
MKSLHIPKCHLVAFLASIAIGIGLISIPTAKAETSGMIKGKITGIDGVPLKGVIVTLLDMDDSLIRKTKSTRKGYYRMPQISPGVYRILFEKDDYEIREKGPFRVSLNQTIQVDIVLEVIESISME